MGASWMQAPGYCSDRGALRTRVSEEEEGRDVSGMPTAIPVGAWRGLCLRRKFLMLE